MGFVTEFFKTLLQTLEETIGLIAMFAIFLATGSFLLAGLVGLVVFEIEAILDKLARNAPPFADLLRTQVVVVTETVFWLVSFFLIQQFGAVATGAFLTITMVFQHTWEDNLAHNRGIFSPFASAEMIPHSTIEGVIAGGAWLYVANGDAGLVGVEQAILAAVLLIVGLGVEHVLGRRLALAP